MGKISCSRVAKTFASGLPPHLVNKSTLVVSVLVFDWKLYQLPSSTPGTPVLLLSGNNIFNQLRINPNNDAILIADQKTAKRSVDFGASWTDLILVPGANQQPEIKRFHFLANGAVLALTNAGVFTSAMEGRTGRPIPAIFFAIQIRFGLRKRPVAPGSPLRSTVMNRSSTVLLTSTLGKT